MIQFRSIRQLTGAAMACTVVLILGMAVVGVSALRSVTRQTVGELTAVQEGTSLGSSLVSAVLSEIRLAEEYLLNPSPAIKAQFLASGDSAYVFQSRMRDLPHLTSNDRRLINQVAVQSGATGGGVRYGPRAGRHRARRRGPSDRHAGRRGHGQPDRCRTASP